MLFNQKKFNSITIIFILFIVLTSLSRIMLSSWDRNCFGFDDGNFALEAQSYSSIVQNGETNLSLKELKIVRFLPCSAESK